MAFPFQFGSSTDPVIAACKDSEFMIYCNIIVPASQRLQFWYQHANLTLAVLLLSSPLVLLLLGCIKKWWRTWRQHRNLVPESRRNVRGRQPSVSSRMHKRRSNPKIEDSQDLITALPPLPPGFEVVQSASSSMAMKNSHHGWTQTRVALGIRQFSRSTQDVRSQTPSIFREDFRKSVRSFTILPEDKSAFDFNRTQNYDLGIIPLFCGATDYYSSKVGSSRCPSPSPIGRGSPSPSPSIQSVLGPGVHTVGLIDLQDLGVSTLLDRGVVAAVRQMDILRLGQGCTGLAIRINDAVSKEKIVELLQTCFDWAIEVIVMCNPDANIWASVDFDLIAGIIVENGCILANGHRRDFFRATRVRQLMGKCAEKRADRPTFFAGFYDLWHNRPSASVVRRSFKLAEFYGAALEHAPLTDAYWENNQRRKLPLSLGAFDYLKRSETVELQKKWTEEYLPTCLGACTTTSVSCLPLVQLESVIPQIHDLLETKSLPEELERLRTEGSISTQAPDWISLAPTRSDFWMTSSGGDDLSSLGCMPLSCCVTPLQYNAVLTTLKQLSDLEMLLLVEGVELLKLCNKLQALRGKSKHPGLLDSLMKGLTSGEIRVYKGLDTGFKIPDESSHMWGLSSISAKGFDIFVSQKASSDIGVVLHTYLAYHGVPRLQRYEEELNLEIKDESRETPRIPINVRSELTDSTPSELLFLIQQMRMSNVQTPLTDAIHDVCSRNLIGAPSQDAWIETCAKGFLEGSVSIEDVLQQRLEDLARRGAVRLPDVDSLGVLYEAVNQLVALALFSADRETLDCLLSSLSTAYGPSQSISKPLYVDINTDLFALILFCVLRKAAFEDVYIEATDRCPFFLTQPDQAAVFSELWVLGSQCEIYFGLRPRALGRIIYDNYRAFLRQYPPVDLWDGKDNFTAYSFSQITEISETTKEKPLNTDRTSSARRAQRKLERTASSFGALSIFCVPAIVDVCLLTTSGRGFFLTAFMRAEDLAAATYALLASLLITAWVTGWVGSVGSMYLHNWAFDNMNMFLTQRLSGGFVITLLVGICGFIAFSVQLSLRAGSVFAAYLLILSTYLNLLGIMATMHFPGSPLTSGRVVLWRTFPILTISPLLSTFVNGYDLAIYLSVMVVFLLLLLLQYWVLCRRWSTWARLVPKMAEHDITAWYQRRLKGQTEKSLGLGHDEEGQEFKETAQLVFREEVDAFTRRRIKVFSGYALDQLVATAAKGLPLANWLVGKGNNGAQLPDAFSNTWFVQLDLAMKSQQQLVRGLKEHSTFFLFRYAKYDLGQNVGFFLMVLMDHWVSLFMSAQSPHHDQQTDARTRYSTALCLLYFLMSAITVDMTLQQYWEKTSKLSDERLVDLQHAHAVRENILKDRRLLWIEGCIDLAKKMGFVLGLVLLSLAFLVENPSDITLFYAYVIGYTSALFTQFNRCFTTSPAAHVKSVFLCAFVGFFVGCLLHAIPTTSAFIYSDVIALNAASLTAAILTSFWAYGSRESDPSSRITPSLKQNSEGYYKQIRIGASRASSFCFDESKIMEGPKFNISSQDNTKISREVTELLEWALEVPNKFSHLAPWSSTLLRKTIDMWCNGCIIMTVANRQSFKAAGLQDSWSYSNYDQKCLSITTGFLDESELVLHQETRHQALSYFLAETILHHTAVVVQGCSHQDAVLAEHLLPETDSITKRIEYQLATESESAICHIIRNTNAELMRHLCLYVDVDIDWQKTPEAVRKAILARISGKPVALNASTRQWSRSSSINFRVADFALSLCLQIHRISRKRQRRTNTSLNPAVPSLVQVPAQLVCHLPQPSPPQTLAISLWLQMAVRYFVSVVKWVAVLTGGASEVERELWYALRGVYFNRFILRVLLTFWRMCWLIRNIWIRVFIISRRPILIRLTTMATRGTSRELCRNSITVELPEKTITGFACKNVHGNIQLQIYNGLLQVPPADVGPIATAIYDTDYRMCSRTDTCPYGEVVSTFQFGSGGRHRWPVSKDIWEPSRKLRCQYDNNGRIVSGFITLPHEQYEFIYHYRKYPKHNSALLRADYRQVGSPERSLFVFWCHSSSQHSGDELVDYDAVPSDKVTRVVRNISGSKFTTSWSYTHKRDPIVSNMVEEGGRTHHLVDIPNVFQDEAQLLVKPNHLSFDSDDLLIYHQPRHLRTIIPGIEKEYGFVSPFLAKLAPLDILGISYCSRKVIYQQLPTSRLRSELWRVWMNSTELDATTACWMDELILRKEPLLKTYWNHRNNGQLLEATRFLDLNNDRIVGAIDVATDVSQRCALLIKIADLYTMGLGKDANQVTNRPDCYKDTDNRISIIFSDIGCWPDAPGGVSNCRRDLVDGLSTIRNHVIGESANDYNIPRYQIEKNVQSMKLLPLWGLDGKTAQHGLIDNLLHSQVDEKIQNTEVQRDIIGIFVPLLKNFVKGARTKHPSRADLISVSNSMLSMSSYFEEKDYNKTWRSKEVENAWIEAWLCPYSNDQNILDASEYFEIERPTMTDFKSALDLYMCYFFIYSVQIPRDCPKVFQSTHHGISSLFGMVLKYRKGTTFGLWDHAILWRESCLNISPAQCLLPIPVQSMLLAGIGLAAKLAYVHVDVVLPCTSVYNPIWEAEIGTDGGRIGSQKLFHRKIDPIVNGISSMDSFEPVKSIRSTKPTVVMLSNIQFIKDIKTAVLAADVIVNEYGFTDYQLLVYGAQDRQPSYFLETNNLIQERNLTNNVFLAGFGNPKEVLKDAWVFMNSSLSEGLPLAIGEAALSGIPIVATEVGATALVLTDPDDPSTRFGEVVAPNDPTALARAQLTLLAMLGQWTKYTGEVAPIPTLPVAPTEADVAWISKRMVDKTEDRRKLGLLSRDVVLRSFHGKRYLREHEQMYWIQWHHARMRLDTELKDRDLSAYQFGAVPPMRFARENQVLLSEEDQVDGIETKKCEMIRWQDFPEMTKKEKKVRRRRTQNRPRGRLNVGTAV